MSKAVAIVHAGPALGAQFTQFTVEFEEGGFLGPPAAQRFIYVLESEVEVGSQTLGERTFAYIPPASTVTVSARRPARIEVFEKIYQPLPRVAPPEFFTGLEDRIKPEPLEGDASIEVRHLLPDDFAFDFAVNVMTYQPGAALPMVESHVMEHGLLMLTGGGIYRLGDRWYPVKAGDFIWMAPYCPQWFGALGKTPAKYLIYKDWNRSPLAQ
jgi:(S)-ureidoglycine aminohydrolase